MAPHEIPHIGFVELVGGGVVQTLRHRLSGEEVAAPAADGVGQWPLAYNEEGKAFLRRPGIAVWAKDFFKRTVLEDGGTVFVQQHGMEESLASHSCSEIYYVPLTGKMHSGRQAYIKVYVDGICATGSAVTWMQMYCHACHCYRSAF